MLIIRKQLLAFCALYCTKRPPPSAKDATPRKGRASAEQSGHNVTASLRRDVDVGDSVMVTGAAGFIGMHVAHRLLAQGHDVLGIDNLNPYYDPGLKAARVAALKTSAQFRFKQMDIADRDSMAQLFAAE